MATSTYRIRKSFLLPLGLVVILCLALLVSAVLLGLPAAKIIIVCALSLPVTLLLAESKVRCVTINAEALQIKKLLKTKTLPFTDMTAIDTVRVRKRVFISLSSEDDFLIISNSYENFGTLVEELINYAPEEAISPESRELAQNPPDKCSDVFSAWLAVAVLTMILFVQLRGLL